MQRLYHIVATNDKTGAQWRMTGFPMSHKDCMTMKSKITVYPWRTLQLVEVKQ